ncbi:LPS export ABC transporter ATP-binding protein [Candidatus Phycosocius spiralis]|uniref:Lipopolysaccharide export system ATP-binding protein LptB n=1 Tax=Candidatus Phycosocius spiralis TaxID=2815099 RepID=A0ABQ4PU35_9PROT|nr:LPS export ABC transporter ATP-binding protein [Candidatus Phycosocius spiralis]GIU66440.1 ABC transporter ATP-binding protein [Candidatus Phycosocius spiralis]
MNLAHRSLRIEANQTSGLIANKLVKSYKGRDVVDGVSLSLQRGEILGLLGPNGAGKTTCFYMVTGLIQPDKGDITLDGQDVTPLPMYVRARLGLGYLPQEPSIFRGMSVQDNVLAVLETVLDDPSLRQERANELLSELRIDTLRKQRATSLSGGERRRLEIARALATDPSFILLDEPFAGIDPLAIADIRDLIGFLKQRGIGVLITDHNVRDTLTIIDRATIIVEGKVLFEGSPDEVLSQADVRRVYLGEDFKA